MPPPRLLADRLLRQELLRLLTAALPTLNDERTAAPAHLSNAAEEPWQPEVGDPGVRWLCAGAEVLAEVDTAAIDWLGTDSSLIWAVSPPRSPLQAPDDSATLPAPTDRSPFPLARSDQLRATRPRPRLQQARLVLNEDSESVIEAKRRNRGIPKAGSGGRVPLSQTPTPPPTAARSKQSRREFGLGTSSNGCVRNIASFSLPVPSQGEPLASFSAGRQSER